LTYLFFILLVLISNHFVISMCIIREYCRTNASKVFCLDYQKVNEDFLIVLDSGSWKLDLAMKTTCIKITFGWSRFQFYR